MWRLPESGRSDGKAFKFDSLMKQRFLICTLCFFLCIFACLWVYYFSTNILETVVDTLSSPLVETYTEFIRIYRLLHLGDLRVAQSDVSIMSLDKWICWWWRLWWWWRWRKWYTEWNSTNVITKRRYTQMEWGLPKLRAVAQNKISEGCLSLTRRQP